MKTLGFNLIRFGFVAQVLLGAADGSLFAQESIIFSRPTDNVTEKANSFMEQQPRKTSSSFNAPAPLFGSKPQADFDILPGASRPKPLSVEEIRQLQKNYDQTKNWTLMTPEEIIGVTTPEKIMGIVDPDQNLSATERYFKRQDRQRSASATNAIMRSLNGDDADGNPFTASRADQKNKNRDSIWNVPDQAGAADRRGRTALEMEQTERRALSPWGGAFTIPAAPPKSDYEVQAALERSRAVSEISAPLSGAPAVSSVPSRLPSGFGQETLRPGPVGDSYVPVRDTASRPVGVAPLATIASARQQALTVPKPKPLVQPPPWVVDESKPANAYAPPTTFQKRKF